MKNFTKYLGVMSLILIFLSGCASSVNTQVKNEGKVNKIKINKQKSTSKHNKSHSIKSKKDDKQNTYKTRSQINLKVGDTANVKTDISHYLLTLNSVKFKNGEINGQKSQLEAYIVADITLKNIGNKTIKAEEAMKNLQLTDLLKGSGEPDDSVLLGDPNAIKGNLKPGQSKSGEAVFQVYKKNKYYLINNPGLVASGVLNNIRFTFHASEAK